MRISLILLLLLIIPTSNSLFVNCIALAKNAYEFISLKNKKNELISKKANLKERLKNYNSKSSIKKAIKEDIRLIEQNEILLRLP
ncbi:MAG: hypothetical protein HRT47_13460 [Candidatus Caenarcaniphilales bacterium]|nr:hypothetical protein [Candidatus Caenarcaniphilales bacterium]